MKQVHNGTMMQYFEWYLKPNSALWKKAMKQARELSKIGITALWLPPAYKGAQGAYDVGYTVYDLYDLGEFNQKGSIATKYGTKDEYLKAIKTLKKYNINVYADVSLDHKIGADETEEVEAIEEDYYNRERDISGTEKIMAWTKFNFPGRNNKYSDFKWNASHFDGVDYDDRTKRNSIFRFKDKKWDDYVDTENGNFDFLMGADIELCNEEVVKELKNWGKWYIDFTDIDGFRIDAAKHTSYVFIRDWIETLRKETGKELFTVGEYWNPNIDVLVNYINYTEGFLSLFDVPLHYNFFTAANSNGNYDMRNIIKGTLMERMPVKAVTFVENHDTQSGQALSSPVQTWFKPLAYAIILLRREGYPCVFYGDYYGSIQTDVQPMMYTLNKLITARKELAYGDQTDYFDHPDIIGWTRSGDEDHKNSGLAVILTNRCAGSKRMYIGKKFAGKNFYDLLENRNEIIKIDNDGCANFTVNGGSVSVWVLKEEHVNKKGEIIEENNKKSKEDKVVKNKDEYIKELLCKIKVLEKENEELKKQINK